MDELAQVYARALFEVAREQGKLDELREQLVQFAEALEGDRQLAIHGHRSAQPFAQLINLKSPTKIA